MGRTDDRFLRLLQIMALTRNGKKTSELALELECSERTIYRDIIRLSGIIPLYQENGRYKLLEDYTLPPLPLQVNEIVSLDIASKGLSRQKGTPYARAIKSAHLKIKNALLGNPSPAFTASDHIQIDIPAPIDYQPKEKFFHAIDQACQKKVTLRMTYRPPGQEPLNYEVEPHGLFFRKSAWYFVGWCPAHSDYGLFRVDRIENLESTGRKFNLQKDFSLSQFVEESWGTFRGKPVEVKVIFRGEAAHLIQEKKRHPSQKVEKRKDGTVLFTATLRGWQEFAWWLMSFGGEAEVLEPPEVRTEIQRKAKEILKVYI